MSQPQSRRELREARRRPVLVPALVGVLVIALLAGAVWLGIRLVGGTDSPSTPLSGATTSAATAPTSTSTSTSPTPTATTTTTADPLAAAAAECASSWKLRSAATRAAATSLGQWDRHLKIMNDLQAGKISVPTAKQLWGPTTKNAEQNVRAFRSADKALQDARVGCPTPPAGVTGTGVDALRACVASTAKLDAVLKTARTAISVWETHLKDQSHFKAGGMTAAAAEAAWRVLWKKGLATMPAYRAAVARASGVTCTLPGA